MKCQDVQKRIDLGLNGALIDLDSVLKSHIESCERCSIYYKEAVQFRKLLNSQSFEVLPGELDDITFEKIIKSPGHEKVKKGIFDSILSLKWVWVPAATAAIVIMFLVSPRIGDIGNGGTSSVQDESIYLGNGIFVESEQEATELAKSLISDDSEIDLLTDELIFGSEVDDLIESLSNDEFEMLYERLRKINGSSG